MSVFDRIRENSKPTAFIVRLQNTALYPALFALVCAISGVCGKEVYLPCIWALTLTVVFGGLFSRDLKVFIVPFFLIYYAIGLDLPEGHYAESAFTFPSFDYSSIIHFVICGLLMASALIYRLISEGYLSEMLKKRGIFSTGLIILALSFALGGAFSSEWSALSAIFGLAVGALLLLIYSLFTVILAHSADGIAYACKTLVCLGYTVAAQVAVILWRLRANGNVFIDYGEGIQHINRSMLCLSWGVATIVGAVSVLPICAALYLMKNGKYPIISFISAALCFAASVVIDTRSAIFAGGAALILGLTVCCFSKRNKTFCRVCAASVVVIGMGAVAFLALYVAPKYPDTLAFITRFLRFDLNTSSLSELFSGRYNIWKSGVEDFLDAPLFGKGFLLGYLSPAEASSNPFSNMYHNLFIQLLGATGVVGLIALLIHLKHTLEVALRRFSADKLLLLGVPTVILLMSLLDNFFFYPNFIIVYSAFLAAAEITLERERQERIDDVGAAVSGKKPRVAFTYVEAGKGHIIPTDSVCEAFEKKYGDRVEVVRSRFFTETGDPRLEKTEKLFSKTVRLQNRSPIWSFLCKLGNLIAGDTFAIYVLLKLTPSGRAACSRAVKHISDLDADVIYTAHWAIPFYVNRCKGRHPYVVCFCPDVYSNGAFNMDCNDFLISSSVGYKRVCGRRMYAGGNVTLVPFPMRNNVKELTDADKKAELREKYGISPDAFVVALSDGGYGLARLEATVESLLRAKQRMTVIALCGTNKELYLRLIEREKRCPENIRLIAVDFTDKMPEYLACADVYAGKSGANSIAEPTALGVPVIVTKCITYIEKGIMRYYVKHLRGALYIPSARKAAKQICRFADDPSLLTPYRQALLSASCGSYDAEASADLLWDRLQALTNKRSDC